jgi:hypothetical protein
MEATRQKELVMVGGLILATVGLTIIAYRQLKKKGIEIKIGR